MPARPDALKPASRPRRKRGPGAALDPQAARREAEAAEQIAAWIARHGVTRCPIAAVSYTTATIPAPDAAAIREHQDRLRAEAASKRGKRKHISGLLGG